LRHEVDIRARCCHRDARYLVVGAQCEVFAADLLATRGKSLPDKRIGVTSRAPKSRGVNLGAGPW